MALSAEVLMKQAAMTAHDYMIDAVAAIDKKFGEGYARAHPELIAAYMQTAALDFMATFGLQGIQQALGSGLEDITITLNRRPLQE